jgi:hypothetical protein
MPILGCIALTAGIGTTATGRSSVQRNSSGSLAIFAAVRRALNLYEEQLTSGCVPRVTARDVRKFYLIAGERQGSLSECAQSGTEMIAPE